MNSNFTVVFDACVLYPAELRSLLMYLSLSGHFRARWSQHIHQEWIGSVLRERPDLSREKLDQVRALMDRHVPGCLVEGYEPLIPGIDLPDPDDRHVVAAAIQTRAEAIVTFNLKDFPDSALEPYHIKAIHPDDFLMDLCDLDIASVITAAQRHRGSLKKPPLTSQDYLDFLLRQRMPQTVAALKPFLAML